MQYMYFLLSILVSARCIQAEQCHNTPGFGIPFSKAMSNFEWYRASWLERDSKWALAYDQYTKYIVDDCVYTPEPRVPKVIHQIWIGSPLPDRYISLIESWKKYHPAWHHILWTDKDIDALGLTNADQYNASTNFGQKADIARYEILYRFGGVYVDIDFECLRPLDIFNHCCDYYTGVAYSGRFCTFNGLIGAVPGHPIVKGCIDTLDINDYYEGTAEHNILFTTGPYHQARNFCEHAAKDESGRAVAFPVNYFYPWPFSKKEDVENIPKWYRPETFAIHYWHAGWRHDKQESLSAVTTQQKWCWGNPFCCFPYFNASLYSWVVSLFAGILWQEPAE